MKLATLYLTNSVLMAAFCLGLGILSIRYKSIEVGHDMDGGKTQGTIAILAATDHLASFLRTQGHSATWSTRYLGRRMPTAVYEGGGGNGTPYTASAYLAGDSASGLSQDWLDAAMGEVTFSPTCGPVIILEAGMVFDSTSSSPTLGFLGVEQTTSSLCVWRRTLADDASAASKFATSTSDSIVTVDYTVAVAQDAQLEAAACLATPCSGISAGITAFEHSGTIHTGFEFTVSETSGTTNIRSRVLLSTQNLSSLLTDELAPSTECDLFIFDSAGYLITTTLAESEASRRSSCLESATTPTERVACGLVLGSSHPDPAVRMAATTFPLSTMKGEADSESLSEFFFAKSIAVPGVSSERLIVVATKVRDNRWRRIVYAIVTLITFFTELALGIVAMLYFRSQFTIPMKLLSKSMRSVMRLEFSELEKDRDVLADLRVDELENLQYRFFEMAEHVRCFSSYVPKEVIRELQETGTLHSRIMTHRTLTCIMVDIANFTTMCEAVSTDDLADMAEKYFGVATRTLSIHGCTIDKFIGDAIMGFWGAPKDYSLQGFSACCGALHLTTVVQRLQPFFDRYDQKLGVRIGLSRGTALVGNIGCEDRIGYTALGPTVLMAEALEGLNKTHQCDIIVSESVLHDAEKTHEGLFLARRVGTVTLADIQGGSEIAKPQPVFQLLGLCKKNIPTTLQKLTQGERQKQRSRATSHASSSRGRVGPSDVASASPQPWEVQSVTSHTGSAPGRKGSHRSSAKYTDSVIDSCKHHPVLMGEKFALLSEEEEISNIRDSVCFGPLECAVVAKISEGVLHYEGMRFEEAVSCLGEVLSDSRVHLATAGIATAPLEKIVKVYEKYTRVRPTPVQFKGGVIKL